MDSPSKYYRKDVDTFLKRIVPQRAKGRYHIFDHTFSYTQDIQVVVNTISTKISDQDRIVVISFNYLWKPILNIATALGFRKADKSEPNWLDREDIKNIFYLAGMEEVKAGNRFIFPIDLGAISDFVNRYISQLPIINALCLTTFQIFRKSPNPKNYSVSIIIPARNEEGNIKKILNQIPKLSTEMEVIFIEGHSKDKTLETIKKEIDTYKGSIKLSWFKQKGVGKANAVRLGFEKAKNELLIILDADISVDPHDLKKFYSAISSGKTELANGSRLVYPMEKQAMRNLNYLGNKVFSLIFSYLLDQRIKDTLCGTKAILRKNYLEIVENRKYFGHFDPFGDYDLIFGSSHLNLKITDIPVRYHERVYGTTNISRFKHGLLLLKMTTVAAKKLKFV